MSLESVSSDRQQPDPKEEGDEAIISMSVGGEVTDSSIMEIGRSRPQFQYSRKVLLEIKVLPLAKQRPDYLDPAYNNSRGVWDPERWHLNKKRSNTPAEEEQQRGTTRSDQTAEPPSNNKRRSGDPRERIRKEQDGIVLSPQRRSFNSGCFVNVSQPVARRPESPIGKPEVSHREPVRRIGSGRLLNRDMWDDGWDAKNMFLKEKLEPERSEFAFRTSTAAATRDRDAREVGRDREPPVRDRDNPREREDRSDRYERRSYGRDFGDREQPRDRAGGERNERGHPMDRCRDRRYSNNERRRNYGEPEEPEWFSSGPTSQHDVIELRGFDDIPEEKSNPPKSKKQSPAQKKRGKKATSEKDDRGGGGGGGGGGDGSVVPKGRSTPTVMDQSMNAVHAPHSPISEQNEEQRENGKERSDTSGSAANEPSEINDRSDTAKSRDDNPADFNLDDFLKSDIFPGVPGLLTNGVGAETGTGSRFSQWFKRESPVQQIDSRRASIQDELLNNLLNDITEPNIQIPSVTESNTYFAPISPANTTSNTENPATGVKLLEMLQRGNKPHQNGQGDATGTVLPMMKKSVIKDMEVGGKVIHSLEELEARMRGGAPAASSNEPPRVNKTEEDLSAFKKLLAQVTGGQAVQAANGPVSQKPPPMTLIQLLNNQLKAQQPPVPEPMPAPSFNHVGPLGPAQHPHQAQMQHENLMKVLRIQQQQQQQQQQKQRQQQQSDMLSMMMSGQQRMVGVSPVPQDLQMLVNNAPSNRELLQRPEAQAIIQGLQQGEITRQHLMQQLQNPAMHHRHREVLINILKMYGGTTPRNVSPHADPILQQILYQQQQQQRIPSPMNNAFCSAPIIRPNLATSPNTLSVQHPVIPHRVPSPRGLVMNTQTIMQNALIKKKLEEQRENYRKRQEHLQQAKQPQLSSQQQQQQQQQQLHHHHHHHHHHQMTSPVNSPSKQTLSPTPLAFTPTSVLRKMTAEKELDGSNESAKLAAQTQQAVEIQQMQSAVQLLAQGVLSRQKPAMGLPPSQPQPQVQVQGSWASPPAKQHNGRPIVKGGNGSQFQYGRPVNFPQPPPPQPQPQQPQPPQRPSAGIYGNPARSKHTMATPPMPHPNVPPYSIASNSIMNQRPNVMNMKAQQVQSHLASMQHQQRTSQVQLVMNHNNAARTDGRMLRSQQINIAVGRQGSPGSNGGSLSPTSNQLARWFSPELLAKARAGKLPELGQTNVLSLEELERLQYASTTVHN